MAAQDAVALAEAERARKVRARNRQLFVLGWAIFGLAVVLLFREVYLYLRLPWPGYDVRNWQFISHLWIVIPCIAYVVLWVDKGWPWFRAHIH